jgi:hypothetical protein
MPRTVHRFSEHDKGTPAQRRHAKRAEANVAIFAGKPCGHPPASGCWGERFLRVFIALAVARPGLRSRAMREIVARLSNAQSAVSVRKIHRPFRCMNA